MRSKQFLVILTLAVTIIGSGCRRSDDGAQAQSNEQVATPTPNIATSDVKGDSKTKTTEAASEKAETNSIVDSGSNDVDFAEREEIRRSYALKAGEKISINRINGSIEIESADIDHVEVLIVRSARKKEDLKYRRVSIEREGEELQIYTENDRRSVFSAFGSIPEGRQRVLLKLPRKTALNVYDLKGNAKIGEMDAPIEMFDINGGITIARLSNRLELRGINGNMDVTMASLSKDGINVSGVNGNFDLRLAQNINANVEVRGVNGQISPEFPNFEEREGGPKRHGRLDGRIGEGGPPIEIRGINGNVSLLSFKVSEVAAKPKNNPKVATK